MLREETAVTRPNFDAVDYLFYIRRRWSVIAIACAIAGTLALGASLLLLPKRYTSTTSILIEPPLATDPRAFIAISPVYLESLRTYERLASGDGLFRRALQKFQMLDPDAAQSVEALKRRILKVTKVRDTKILDISVTLENATQAQAMAQFLAEETVRLSAAAARDSGEEAAAATRQHLQEGRDKLEQARLAWTKYVANQPVETLKQEIESLVELQQRLRRNAAEARATAAEYGARASGADTEFFVRESASHEARARQLTVELQKVERQIAEKDRLAGSREAKREMVEAQLKLAQKQFDTASTRLETLESSAGLGGERLKVIDAGIVPQRPSEPKTGLNLVIAVGLAFLGSMVYLTLAYNLYR